MDNVLDRLQLGSRVAVIRLRSLGDCVLTTPALRILKAARPDLQISVVVEKPFAPVFEGNPDVERIILPGAAELARSKPDLALNLHGGTRSAQLTVASRARLRAGFQHFRFGAIYNIRIPRAQEILGVDRTVHTAEHLASAIFYLGAPRQEIPRACLFADRSAIEPARPIAVFHPMASAPDKTWPARSFLQVAGGLKTGFEPVFIGGPSEDLSAFAGYRCVSGAPLDQIKSLLAQASLFVGNDSGPAHMAGAFGVPSVVIFGPSDHEVWAPWKTPAAVFKSDDISSIDAARVSDAITQLRSHHGAFAESAR